MPVHPTKSVLATLRLPKGSTDEHFIPFAAATNVRLALNRSSLAINVDSVLPGRAQGKNDKDLATPKRDCYG